MKTIFVNSKDLGYWTQTEITVQRFDTEGELLYCNHAGAVEEEVENEILRVDQPDIVWNTRVMVCNKCPAHKIDGDDYWQDAPYEGLHEI